MATSGGPDGISSPRVRRPLTRTNTAGFTDTFDSEVVPSSLPTIAPILRVANEVEADRPRVAYLCTCISALLKSCSLFCVLKQVRGQHVENSIPPVNFFTINLD